MKKATTRFSRANNYNHLQRIESSILDRVDRVAAALAEGLGVKAKTFGCHIYDKPKKVSAHNLRLIS